ncbi:NOL1/NOP2/sun family protein [Besnoitia besnoiti]|uniref:NOL1/NOP2/sun family protein n=1 Tax=Besnoitia besnoiti TaxID=94643 RepID=A0A2A9M0V9_BESBE|nr:NOL1/NOP2/sun family protein [Besnoitia besnoiti]PFH31615.1 NOL1/NOP2/sun family protein [Besnoitia besnoiti]
MKRKLEAHTEDSASSSAGLPSAGEVDEAGEHARSKLGRRGEVSVDTTAPINGDSHMDDASPADQNNTRAGKDGGKDDRGRDPRRRDGGRRRRGKGRKENNGLADNTTKEEGAKAPYEPLIYENADFEAYYKAQEICPPEEWDEFMACVKTPLPAAVRVNRSAPLWRSTVRLLKQLSQPTDKEGTEETLQNLPWMPHEIGWQWSTVCKIRLRRDKAFKRIRQHIMNEDFRGGLTRQEAVSMLPCLFLDVQPDHRVLDMCASPGSKTTEILDMLQWSTVDALNKKESASASLPGLEPPTGFVIANDVDVQRTQTLAHQCMKVPSPVIAISCFDAGVFPLTLPDGPKGESRLQFDRILADVPCSGDGTMRKNGDLWRKWSVSGGLSLHSVQLGILHRGLQLLRVGGRLVYSTCSLSPLEDEAVIAAALVQYGDAIELVEPPSLPGLRFSKGKTSWLVPVPDSKKKGEKVGEDATSEAEKDAEAEQSEANGDKLEQKFFKAFADVPEPLRGKIKPTMFPPPSAAALHLDRAVRVLPHQNNTGGFFVACFRKTRELPERSQRGRYKTLASDPSASSAAPPAVPASLPEAPPAAAASPEPCGGALAAAPAPRPPAASATANPLLDEEDLSPAAAAPEEVAEAPEAAPTRPALSFEGHASVALAIAASQPGSLFHTLLPIDLLDEEGVDKIFSFYGFSREFAPALVKGDLRAPEAVRDLPLQQLTRRLHTPKRLYFVSESFSHLLHLLLLAPSRRLRAAASASAAAAPESAALCAAPAHDSEPEAAREGEKADGHSCRRGKNEVRMKWLHAGVKVLVQHSETQQLSCQFGADGWRIAQEGAALMARYMRRRILFLNLDVAASLLLSETRIVNREELLAAEAEGKLTALDSCRDPETGALEPGGCVCVVCSTTLLPASRSPSLPSIESLADAICLSCLMTPGGHLHCYVSRKEVAGLVYHIFGVEETDGNEKDETNDEDQT